MCLTIETHQDAGFLAGENSNRFLGVKSFKVLNYQLYPIYANQENKYTVIREDQGLIIASPLKKQEIELHFDIITDFKLHTHGREITHSIISDLGMHISPFSSINDSPQKPRISEDIVMAMGHYNAENIPVIFDRWSIQLAGDDSIVVRTFVIPPPAVLYELFPQYPIRYLARYEPIWIDVFKMIEENG